LRKEERFIRSIAPFATEIRERWDLTVQDMKALIDKLNASNVIIR